MNEDEDAAGAEAVPGIEVSRAPATTTGTLCDEPVTGGPPDEILLEDEAEDAEEPDAGAVFGAEFVWIVGIDFFSVTVG
jgi:hypothetical protein